MTFDELMKLTTVREVSKVLDISVPAIYKWKNTNTVPELRLFQLREKKPEWFKEEK